MTTYRACLRRWSRCSRIWVKFSDARRQSHFSVWWQAGFVSFVCFVVQPALRLTLPASGSTFPACSNSFLISRPPVTSRRRLKSRPPAFSPAQNTRRCSASPAHAAFEYPGKSTDQRLPSVAGWRVRLMSTCCVALVSAATFSSRTKSSGAGAVVSSDHACKIEINFCFADNRCPRGAPQFIDSIPLPSYLHLACSNSSRPTNPPAISRKRLRS